MSFNNILLLVISMLIKCGIVTAFKSGKGFVHIPTKLINQICKSSKKSYQKIRMISDVKTTQDLEIQTLKRPLSNNESLTTLLLASNPELVLQHMKERKVDNNIILLISDIKQLRENRNQYVTEGDKARNLRKSLSKDIGILLKEGKSSEADDLKRKVEESAIVANDCDEKLAVIESQIEKILKIIPNLLDDRVPFGVSDADNIEIFNWGSENRKIGDSFLWHDELAASLNGINTEAASKISGARFSVLKGPIAKLERALIQYFLDFHSARGYTEVSVPFIVSRSTLEGTGQLPKFEEDLFKVNHLVSGEDAFLIPTAEVPVTNLYRDQLLNATQLPIHMVCYSPSFRAEAGSYGRDTRGLLRQHQFHKVELVKICSPESSNEEHEALTADAEALLQSLDLPYRKVLLCSADTGFSARICYDLEVWLPGQQEYREISSCSNCYDFQSRRMFLRYKSTDTSEKSKNKSQTKYPHTMNGSGLAVGRALIAILENYQEPDGSILLPEVLRPYMGGIDRIKK